MGFPIKDGSSGQLAHVDSLERVHTHATTESELRNAILRGKTWNAGTSEMTLTTANASALYYLRNNAELPLVVDLYVMLLKASTGGTGLGLVEILRNPDTTGTIVTTGTPVANPVNMNFGSATPLDSIADAFQGAEGATLLNEDDILYSQINNAAGPDRFLLPIITELAQGSSLGLRYTPPAGNTSQGVRVVLEVYQNAEKG